VFLRNTFDGSVVFRIYSAIFVMTYKWKETADAQVEKDKSMFPSFIKCCAKMIHSSVFISFKPISSLGRLTPLLVHFSAVAISHCHLHSSKSDGEDPIETF
jgi:hypothetical protein